MRDHGFEQGAEGAEGKTKEKLDSWKEIAAYLGREVRTVQRWEKQEALPVHRHHHYKLGSVYAYRSELEAWIKQREPGNSTPAPATEAAGSARPSIRKRKITAVVVLAVITLLVIAARAGDHLVSPHAPR